MEPVDYLRVIRRRWRILAACVLVAGVLAWITTPAEPEDDSVTYRATHQLIRDSSAAAPPALASLSVFVKTGAVPQRVAERIGYEGEPAVLARDIELEPNEQLGTLDISAPGGSREEAADLANAFAEETLAYLGEEATEAQEDALAQANDRLTTLQAEIDALDQELEAAEEGTGSTGVIEAERDSKLRQYGAALDQREQLLSQPPPTAGYATLQEALPELAGAESGGFSAPQSRPARTGLALVLGLFLGLAAVLVAERFDTRFNTREAVEAGFQLPVIAEVPKVNAPEEAIVSVVDPMSSAAEAYRTARSALVLMPRAVIGAGAIGDGEPQVVLVTSPAPGDGKTTTVANLAASFAEAGRSVLVMGCDFRRPEIHRYFDTDNRPGVADVLMDRRRDLASIVRPTSVPGVSVAPSGSTLRSFGDVANAGRALVQQARQLADVVIIDTPPILATNDATELIPAVDAVVVVARVGRTSLDGAKRTHRLLERLAAPAAGVILVGTTSAEGSYSRYYTSVAPEPAPSHRRWFRRGGEDIGGRIEPWHGTRPDALRSPGGGAPSVTPPRHTAAPDRGSAPGGAPRPADRPGGVPADTDRF